MELADLEGYRVVDGNGELIGNALAVLQAFIANAQQTIDELKENNFLMHKELEQKLRTISHLRKDSASKLREHIHYETAMEVLEYWQKLCHPEARELEGDRLRAVLARLTGRPQPYTADLLKQSVLGYSKFPYLIDGKRRPHGRPAQRFIDAELIFRDPKHVDQGLALAKQAEDLQSVAPPVVSSLPPTLSELGRAAVHHAARGRPVFPCRVNAKQPANAHGLLSATADLERVSNYWTRVPAANVGLRTGTESGIVVLDVDGEDGFASLRELEATHGKLPPTLSVVTPRGGNHFYFAHPEVGQEIRNTQGVPGLGLDIRGDGGYVLTPPSKVDGRNYEWDERSEVVPLPGWLTKLLLNYQKAASSLDPKDWEELVTKGVKEGARNAQLLKVAGKLIHLGTDPGFAAGMLLPLNELRCDPPLSEKEVFQIVQSCVDMEHRKALKQVA